MDDNLSKYVGENGMVLSKEERARNRAAAHTCRLLPPSKNALCCRRGVLNGVLNGSEAGVDAHTPEVPGTLRVPLPALDSCKQLFPLTNGEHNIQVVARTHTVAARVAALERRSCGKIN